MCKDVIINLFIFYSHSLFPHTKHVLNIIKTLFMGRFNLVHLIQISFIQLKQSSLKAGLGLG